MHQWWWGKARKNPFLPVVYWVTPLVGHLFVMRKRIYKQGLLWSHCYVTHCCSIVSIWRPVCSFDTVLLHPAMPSTTQGARQAYEPGLSHRNISGGSSINMYAGTENSCSMDLYLVLSWLLTAQLTDCACLLFIPLQHDVMGSQWYILSGDAAKGITNKCKYLNCQYQKPPQKTRTTGNPILSSIKSRSHFID